MLTLLLLYINLCIASIDFDEIHRIRRQSPFLDGIQPPVHKDEPRRILSTSAHRKAEA